MISKYEKIQSWCLAIMAFRYLLHFVPFIGYSNLYIRISQAAAVISMLLLLISIRSIKLEKREILLSIFSVIIIYIFLLKYNFFALISSITYVWSIALMCISGTNLLKQAFMNFVRIYALSLISSIILYPFIVIGAISPVEEIRSILEVKDVVGMYYENYLLTFKLVQTQSDYISDASLYRLSGFFDEPGVVGTFSAFILIILGYRLRDWKSYVILSAGVLSFSLAFYLISALYFILKGSTEAKAKILTALVIFYVIGSSIPYIQERVFDRVLISDGRIAGDNRLTEDTAITIAAFFESDDKWMGNSKRVDESEIAGSASWQALIWDYGIVGSFVMSVFFFLLAKSKPIVFTRQSVIFLILFVASIYQRPHVFEPSYILLFIGGLVSISNELMGKLEINAPILS